MMNLLVKIRMMFLVFSALLVVAGCDGNANDDEQDATQDATSETNPDEPTCAEMIAEFSGCGGELLGNWDLKQFCVDEANTNLNPFSSIPQCADVPYEASITGAQGVMSFQDDMTGSSTLVVTTDVSIEYNDECLVQLGSAMGYTPEQFCESMNQAFQSEMDGTCGYSSSLCICTGVGERQLIPDFTWESSGNTLTLNGNGLSTSMEYCIDSGVMTMRDSLDIGGMANVAFVGSAEQQ